MGWQRGTDLFGSQLSPERPALTQPHLPLRTPSSRFLRAHPTPASHTASPRETDCVRWTSQPGRISPPPRPAITHSSGMPRLRGSVGGWVLLLSRRGAGAAGASGLARLHARSLDSRLARGGSEVRSGERGRDQWGWRRPPPIMGATAPSQHPHLALAVRGRRGPAAPCIPGGRARPPPAGDYNRTGLPRGQGPEEEGRGPRTSRTPWVPALCVPFGISMVTQDTSQPSTGA